MVALPGPSAVAPGQPHVPLSGVDINGGDAMKLSRKVFGTAVLALLMMITMTSEAMGQGRGRRASRSDKKCEKFVNCHDARDGRWDGRGPNRRIVFSDRVFRRNRRNRDFEVRNRRNRHRDFDRDRNWRRRR
jgi:hypothetical protein